MQGLNARVALRLLHDLGDAPLDAPTLQSLYESMTRNAKKPSRPKGEPMTDLKLEAKVEGEPTPEKKFSAPVEFFHQGPEIHHVHPRPVAVAPLVGKNFEHIEHALLMGGATEVQE